MSTIVKLLILLLVAEFSHSCNLMPEKEREETIEEWITENAETVKAQLANQSEPDGKEIPAPEIFTDKQVYNQGNTVKVTAKNVAGVPVIYSPYIHNFSLHRKEDGEWKVCIIDYPVDGNMVYYDKLFTDEKLLFKWHGTIQSPEKMFYREYPPTGTYRFSFLYWIGTTLNYPQFPSEYNAYSLLYTTVFENPKYPVVAYSNEFEIKEKIQNPFPPADFGANFDQDPILSKY